MHHVTELGHGLGRHAGVRPSALEEIHDGLSVALSDGFSLERLADDAFELTAGGIDTDPVIVIHREQELQVVGEVPHRLGRVDVDLW